MRVYFDNAATTPIDPEVIEAMMPYLREQHGNPSSIHWHGRQARSAIERSRKTIADLLGATPAEIFFTSGGTEADNSLICSAVESYGITHGITSRIEHHAVLHTMENLEKQGKIKLSFVDLDEKGHLDMASLEKLLQSNPKSLVSLMHANNEIGNLNDLDAIGELCSQYDAVYHSDTVQTIGHYKHTLNTTKVHCVAGSAHKFHGPKGIGFMYISNDLQVQPFIHGGSQERNMRGGTENVYGIVGLAKALEIAYRDMDAHQKHVQAVKDRLIGLLTEKIDGIAFNGDCANAERSLYTVLNVCLPESPDNDMLLFNLDIAGISASGGSACSSGSNVGSHVLTAIGSNPSRGAVRFSFSKNNTMEEADFVAEKLATLYSVTV